MQSHMIQDLIARGEKPVIVVHVNDNDEIVEFAHDCVYQLVLKSKEPLSVFGKVEVIKQVADFLSECYKTS